MAENLVCDMLFTSLSDRRGSAASEIKRVKAFADCMYFMILSYNRIIEHPDFKWR